MRLTGSFQTIVTQGVSGTASWPASGRSTSTSAGATLTGRHLLCLPSVSTQPGVLGPSPRRFSPKPAPLPAYSVRSLPLVTDHPNPSTALLTDHYELTMLAGALRSGAAARRAVFEVFARSLPHGRRYGVVAGTGRLLDALEQFRFGQAELDFLRRTGVADEATLRYLE